MSDGIIGPKEMVVTTAFFVKQSTEGHRNQVKPVFTTSQAVFSRFEQLNEVMEWAIKEASAESKKLLKIEIAPNSR